MARTVPTLAFAGVPRVNLMPPVEIERRRRASLVRGWMWALVAAIIVALLIIAGALALKLLADQRLVAEQARTTELLTQLDSLSEVSGALGAESELTSFRADAMGSDFAWAPVISSIDHVLPADVHLVAFDVVSGGTPQSDTPDAEVGLAGTISLESSTAIDLPETIRAIRGVESVAAVDGRALTSGEESIDSYRYELDIVFDQSIYSGAFKDGEAE